MIVIILFVILLLLAAVYALRRGGAPEQLAAGSLVIAMLATFWVGRGATFRSVQWEVLAIDAGLFAALCAIALYADRFWPMWLAAFQLVAVASHGASAYDPTILPVAYWWIVGKISYPMVLILAVGVLRHDRRKRRGYPEFAWSWQRRAIVAADGDA